MGDSEVALVSYWASPFSMRVRVALAVKEIEYERKDEASLTSKSPLLLELNPVHKKVPVLVHKGKPVPESLLAVQYLEEVWQDRTPLLPSDPYLRSQARFWADFVDNKVAPHGVKIWQTKGEAQEAAKKALIEGFKVLEEQLGDKPFFGGESFGYVDVALVPFFVWLSAYESCANFSLEADCPKIIAWGNRCLEIDAVSQSVPDRKKIVEIVFGFRKMAGLA